MNNIKEVLCYAKNNGYFVDKQGNVYSPTKQLSLTKRTQKNRNYSYYHFSIRYYGKRIAIPAHKFIGYCKFGEKIFENNIKIRHLDGDSLNNTWNNILIGTHSENMLDIPQKQRIEKSINASKKSRRFTDEEVKKIMIDRNNELSYKELCEKYDTSKSTLSYLFNSAYYSGMRINK